MAVRISSKLHRELLDRAAASPASEICGLLIGATDVERIVPTKNVAGDPTRSFEIDPVALFGAIRAERAGRDSLLGYYHSHPTGAPTPSRRDAAMASPDGKVWIIIGEGRARAWQLDETLQFNEIAVTVTD
jgi:desampylase